MDTILRAKNDDDFAMREILDYYEGYIHELATQELFDVEGNTYIQYDRDMHQELRWKLVREIRKHFEVRQVGNKVVKDKKH